jgi:hypothetical protein
MASPPVEKDKVDSPEESLSPDKFIQQNILG